MSNTPPVSAVSDLVRHKSELRRQLRQARQALSPQYRRQAAQRVAKLARPYLKSGRRIALYQAYSSEISLQPLLMLARQQRCRVFLPVVPKRGRRLSFTEWQPQQSRYRNRFGIVELRGVALAAKKMHTIFMPLLGFDLQGYRLGQGGGFYDATLAFRRHHQHLQQPRLVGVAFACQQVAAVPTEAWDLPLDAVLTERGRRVFSSLRSQLRDNA